MGKLEQYFDHFWSYSQLAMPRRLKKWTSANLSVTSHTVTRTEWIDSRVEMSRALYSRAYVQMHFAHVSDRL